MGTHQNVIHVCEYHYTCDLTTTPPPDDLLMLCVMGISQHLRRPLARRPNQQQPHRDPRRLPRHGAVSVENALHVLIHLLVARAHARQPHSQARPVLDCLQGEGRRGKEREGEGTGKGKEKGKDKGKGKGKGTGKGKEKGKDKGKGKGKVEGQGGRARWKEKRAAEENEHLVNAVP
ncbi:unnamed protein product [Closterium sp. NIES-53]